MPLPKVLTMFVPNKGNALSISLSKSETNAEENLKVVTPDGGVLCQNATTGNAIRFGVGASGVSRGIYDVSSASWIYHFNESIGTEIRAPSESSVIKLLADTTSVKYVLETEWIDSPSGKGLAFNYRKGQVAGAWGSLQDGSAVTYPGGFFFDADNGTNNVRLLGLPSGSLSWGGKAIETVNSQGSGYVRFNSGLQICWGASTGGAYKTITLPVPFKDTNYAVFFMGDARLLLGTSLVSTTTLECGSSAPSLQDQTCNGKWLAVGSWK